MIPITFNKDDLNNVKKGTVRGQDLATFLSISMPKRAGILDVFENSCQVYNVTVTTGYATLTLHKGYVNIFGRCIYVEEGEQVQVQLPTSGSVTGTFGIRVDLSESGANEVTWFTKTTTLRQDNILTNEISGIYEFGLYTYTATSNSFTLDNFIAPKIENIADYLKGANFTTQANDDKSTKLATTEFVQNIADTIKTIGNNNPTGSVKLGNGLIIKWGRYTPPATSEIIFNGTYSVFFDNNNAFTNAPYVVVATPIKTSGYDYDDYGVNIRSYMPTGFTYSTYLNQTIMYIAIGI